MELRISCESDNFKVGTAVKSKDFRIVGWTKETCGNGENPHACAGFVLSDFGDFMRTAANKAAEDEPNLDKIQVDLGVFEAYTKGYLEKASFLTALEKQLLPYGCRLMTYMQTVRFLTDFLNGDTYYKIQYPDHNWVRTQAQFRLLQEQERLADAMRNIVEKY